MVVLCLLGIFVAGYLSWAEVTGGDTACINKGKVNCEAVQSSAYSRTLGIPVALFGLAGYVAILAVVILEDQHELAAIYGRVLAVAFALFGVMFSVYLSALEGTVLDKWCQWCVMSAVLISLLLVAGGFRMYRFLEPLRH